MLKRAIPLVLASTVAVAAGSQALAGSARGPSKARLDAVGGSSMKPNRYVKDGMRFSRDQVAIRSGGVLTIRNRTPEPHTFSVVKRSDQPRNIKEMDACFEGGVCSRLFQAHGVPEDGGPPQNPVVDVGEPGIDRIGDSVAFGPKGSPGGTVKLDITAEAGTTLRYLCAIHPWMQGRLNTK